MCVCILALFAVRRQTLRFFVAVVVKLLRHCCWFAANAVLSIFLCVENKNGRNLAWVPLKENASMVLHYASVVAKKFSCWPAAIFGSFPLSC